MKMDKATSVAARKDWANSPLFDCVIRSHSLILLKQGLIDVNEASKLGIQI